MYSEDSLLYLVGNCFDKVNIPLPLWITLTHILNFIRTFFSLIKPINTAWSYWYPKGDLLYYLIKVITPPKGNILDQLAEDSRFSELLDLIKIAGIGDTLEEDGPFTVFAPTNEVRGKGCHYEGCVMKTNN